MRTAGKLLSKFQYFKSIFLLLILYSECADDNGNFVCQVKLPDGTEIKGLGKSKRFARQSAGKKIEEIISKSLFH